MKKHTVSSRGIIIKGNKVLLIHRFKNGTEFYTIPGGKVKKHETLEQCLVREISEETSIDINNVRFLEKFESDSKTHNLFLCEYTAGTPKLGNANEARIENRNPKNKFIPEWVTLEEIQNFTIQPNVCENFFKDFVKARTQDN